MKYLIITALVVGLISCSKKDSKPDKPAEFKPYTLQQCMDTLKLKYNTPYNYYNSGEDAPLGTIEITPDTALIEVYGGKSYKLYYSFESNNNVSSEGLAVTFMAKDRSSIAYDDAPPITKMAVGSGYIQIFHVKGQAVFSGHTSVGSPAYKYYIK